MLLFCFGISPFILNHSVILDGLYYQLCVYYLKVSFIQVKIALRGVRIKLDICFLDMCLAFVRHIFNKILFC